jgi:hypothetical protein
VIEQILLRKSLMARASSDYVAAEIAGELVRLKVDVIVAVGAATAAVKQMTSVIPMPPESR